MASQIDLSQFHEVFFDESFEGLEVMESGLLNMNPGNPDAEVINNVFRAAHSIKGGAGTFGFHAIADFTHVMESLLDEVRSKSIPITESLIQILLESTDFVKYLLTECKHERPLPEAEMAAFKDRLTGFVDNPDAIVSPARAAAGIADAAGSGEPASEPVSGEVSADEDFDSIVWTIVIKPAPHLLLSGNEPYRLIRELEEFGKVEVEADLSDLPAFAQINPEYCYLSWVIKLSSKDATESDISQVFEWLQDEAEISIESSDPLQIEESPTEEKAKETAQPGVTSESPVYSTQANEVSSIRVNIDRVDHLVNLVGELVITQSILNRFKQGVSEHEIHDLVRALEQLEENTLELQEQTMRIRMLPVETVFQRMPRLVRDLSISLGKEAKLIITGKSTEVDKTVLEKITDPLTHLVRNSLDHGIESPAKRVAKGKPSTGTIEIKAFHEGGNIVIEVTDDGNGLDKERIRAKAVEKGLIEEDTYLSEAQLFNLIFAPGFSTAEIISDVSGRGVGMDVVKNNIEQLNGSISVFSKPDQGSTFSIRLPLTLAIIEGQLVRVGNETFIIPILSILKSTRIDSDHYHEIAGGSATFRLDDEYIPILRLSDVYKITPDSTEITDGILVVVDGVGRFGVLVDEVLGQQQVVVKSLESNFRQVSTISGATILGDGTIAMILDIGGLLKETNED